MPAQLNPYITFGTQARQAMEFYRSVFGGQLALDTFGAHGDPESPTADLIMHARLVTSRGFVLMASDSPPGMDQSSGSAISISLSGDEEDELRRYWDGLCEGGTVLVPLEPQTWGDVFGMCTDRYGITWMVNIMAAQ